MAEIYTMDCLFDVSCILLYAIIAALCVGILVEPAPDEVGESAFLLYDYGLYRAIYILVIIYCICSIFVRAILSWDVFSLAGIITLVCGLSAVAINYAFNRVKKRKWKKISTPLVGFMMALCGAAFICIVILPAYGDFAYEAKIAPPEQYPLLFISK